MNFASPLFWLILLFLVILVWFDGVAAGKGISTDGQPGKLSLWQRGGQFFRRIIKNPTPTAIFGLFLVLLLFRLLVGLLPLLVFLFAAWLAR